jgi:hypothetical protein
MYSYYITGIQRRRRSSLAQLTDILREWSSGSVVKRQKPPLNRRETLADLARNLPWNKAGNENGNQRLTQVSQRKRRESSAESGMRSMKQRRDSTFTRKDERDERDENISPNSNDFQNVRIFFHTIETKSV